MNITLGILSSAFYNKHARDLGSSEWTIIDFLCVEESRGIEGLLCEVKLQRRHLFYLLNIVMPSLLLLLLGGLVLLIDPSSGERVSLAITLLLAMMVFQLVVMENIPPTSKVVPLLGKSTLQFILKVCVCTFSLHVPRDIHGFYFPHLDRQDK